MQLPLKYLPLLHFETEIIKGVRNNLAVCHLVVSRFQFEHTAGPVYEGCRLRAYLEKRTPPSLG